MNNYSGFSESILPCAYLVKYSLLDNMLQYHVNENNTVILYFDVKNIITGIHRDAEIIEIVELYKKQIDQFKIAKTIIFLANHYARYFNKRNIDYKFVFFDDRGVSKYHEAISKDYKKNRMRSKTKISDIFLDQNTIEQHFSSIYDHNITILCRLFKYMQNVTFIKLTNLESDFIPYFTIKEFYMNENGKTPNDKYCHIILGNDKDFNQLLFTNNIFQISKKNKEFHFISRTNAMESFVKEKDYIKTLTDPRFIPLILAIAGDDIDGVKGISGLGYPSTYKLLNSLYEYKVIDSMDITPDKFLMKVSEYVKINRNFSKNMNIKKILSHTDEIKRNYKLVSFKELYDTLRYTEKSLILEQFEKSNEKVTMENLIYNLKRICVYEGSYMNLLEKSGI